MESLNDKMVIYESDFLIINHSTLVFLAECSIYIYIYIYICMKMRTCPCIRTNTGSPYKAEMCVYEGLCRRYVGVT
jgi:hypothetical protein